MRKTFICPFCGKEMNLSNNTFVCYEHSLIVDPIHKVAHFDQRAEKHFLESQRFLNLFSETDPSMVLSPYKLFDKSFTVDACKFVNTRNESKAVKAMDIKNLNIKLDVMDNHLIAGMGVIADIIGDYFKHGIAFGTDNNPLVFDAVPKAEKWLWLKVLLTSVPYAGDSKIDRLTNAYFAPTLEQKIGWLTDKFNVSMRPLNNEEMLYSHIVTEPWKNIQWGAGYDNLKANVSAFVMACLKDIDAIEVEEKEDTSKLPDFFTKCNEWHDQFCEAYYGAMPSTAINQGVSDEFVSFDILNHEFSHNYFAGYIIKKPNKDFVAVYNTWLICKALYDKYCKNEDLLGYNYKMAWLSLHNVDNEPIYKLTPNMLVVKFWQVMYKELQKDQK